MLYHTIQVSNKVSTHTPCLVTIYRLFTDTGQEVSAPNVSTHNRHQLSHQLSIVIASTLYPAAVNTLEKRLAMFVMRRFAVVRRTSTVCNMVAVCTSQRAFFRNRGSGKGSTEYKKPSSEDQLCWYHLKFRDQARYCTGLPCPRHRPDLKKGRKSQAGNATSGQ